MNQIPNINPKVKSILASGGFLDEIGGVEGAATAAAGIGTTVLGNLSGNKPKAPNAPTFGTTNEVEELFSAGQSWQPVNLGRRSAFGQGASGLLSGAASGASAGPWGALGGGVLGGLSGIFGAGTYNERAKREEERYSRNSANNFSAQNDKIESNTIANAAMNYAAYGGQFDNGLTEFNVGGLHEENPNGGIPQGVGQNGKQNVVEEGETKFDDYIFSNRLKLNVVDPKLYNLPKKLKGKSFAAASEKLGKESKERPYDPISKNGLLSNMNRLKQAQETTKEVEQLDQDANMLLEDSGLGEQLFAKGGNIHIKKSKRGTFTAAATRHGMSVQAFAKKVLANKDEYSPAMVKKANFARNSTKWKHEFGGFLFPTNPNAYPNGGSLYYEPTVWNGDMMVPTVSQGYMHTYPGRDAPVIVQPSAQLVRSPQRRVTPTRAPYETEVELSTFERKDPEKITIPGWFGDGNSYLKKLVEDAGLQAPTVDTNKYTTNRNRGDNLLRYAPVLTNLGLAISDVSQSPETVNYQRVSTPSRGRYAQMEYFDRNPIVNAMTRRANTTIDTLRNSSAGNRATFMANAAVAGNQAQRNVGDMLQKIQEDEYNRRSRTLAFNNQVDDVYNRNRMYADQYNARADMQEQQINAMNRAAQRNAVREGISTMGTTLGQIGRESLDRTTVSNMFGYDWLGRPTNRSAKGGKLTKKGGK